MRTRREDCLKSPRPSARLPSSSSVAIHSMLSLSCILYSARGLVVGIWVAAKAGRLLPRLTLLLPVHAVIHAHYYYYRIDDATVPNNAPPCCRRSDDVRYYECGNCGYYRFAAISISRYLLVVRHHYAYCRTLSYSAKRDAGLPIFVHTWFDCQSYHHRSSSDGNNDNESNAIHHSAHGPCRN